MMKIYKSFLPNSDNSLNSIGDFIKKLKEIKIEKDVKMASFDIINLYPSVDMKEINQKIIEEMDRNYQNPEIKNTVIRTSNLIINENYYKFNKKFYKQKGGVLMVFPVSGILTELKLVEIIRKFKSIIVY